MKRLVYSPKVSAYVETDFGSFDISDYITAGGVQRKLDQVSTAQLTLRNPSRKWTDHSYKDLITGDEVVGPVFHPMDPITIVLTRLQNRPVQVFTGYLDKTPYLQLIPNTVTLQASCTLKRLMYTFFDPGLPFFNEFLAQYGWQTVDGIGMVKPNAGGVTAKTKGDRLNDSGFGQILYAVLNQIGNWDDSTIFIENLPDDLIQLCVNLFTKAQKQSKEADNELTGLLHQIIGTATLGSGDVTVSSGGSTTTSPVNGSVTGTNMTPSHAQFVTLLAGYVGLSLKVIGAWVAYENGPDDNPLNIGPGNSYGSIQAGAKATSDLLHTSAYSGIMATVGKSDQDQCAAIAASSWCPGCAGYEAALLSLLNDIKVVSK